MDARFRKNGYKKFDRLARIFLAGYSRFNEKLDWDDTAKNLAWTWWVNSVIGRLLWDVIEGLPEPTERERLSDAILERFLRYLKEDVEAEMFEKIVKKIPKVIKEVTDDIL